MRLIDLVRRPQTKQNVNEVIQFIGEDETLFSELMELFLSDDQRISQRASWALGHIGEAHPQLLQPHLDTLLEQMRRNDRHNSIRRNTVRIFQFVDIPESISGELYSLCLAYIEDPKEMIAVRAFSMTVCERIASRYPDLIPELIATIENATPTGSAGIKNRGYHTLNRLQKRMH